MHVGIGISCTVSGDQELRVLIKGGLCRNQLDLAGPLAQAGNRLCCTERNASRSILRKLHHF